MDSKFDSIFDAVSIGHSKKNYNTQPIMLDQRTMDAVDDLAASVQAFCAMKSPATCNEIAKSLDKLYPDTHCKGVIYTSNTDNPFFGLVVMPVFDASLVYEIINGTTLIRVPEYYVEIDSKLIDILVGRESYLAALIIRDTSELLYDCRPIRQVRQMIDEYLVQTNSVIQYTDSIHYKEILLYGICDALRKITSIFDNPAVIAPNEISARFEDITVDAMNKIKASGLYDMRGYDNTPIVMLSWALRLYNDILYNRIPARHTLKKAIKFTGSKIETKQYENLLRRIDRIDDYSLLHEGAFDAITDTIHNFFRQMKTNGVSKYEDDLYELQFEANNCETQEEALLLLHRINSRIGVISDFINTECETKGQRNRWGKLLSEYNKLRNDLSKQKIYQNKTRLYVNYGYDD